MVDQDNNREKQFQDIHNKLWSGFEMSGFPLPYREVVDGMMQSASLTVLTTIENIEVLREEAGRENKYNPNQQIKDFCRSFLTLLPENVGIIPGSYQDTIKKIANGIPTDEWTDVDWTNQKIIKESLSRSSMKKEETAGPYKQSWGQT